jgi:hypothetical protein
MEIIKYFHNVNGREDVENMGGINDKGAKNKSAAELI